MGLFGFLKKRKNKSINSNDCNLTTEKELFIGDTIQRDVTQEVAICMNEMKITSMPILKFFHNDNGLFEGIYLS